MRLGPGTIHIAFQGYEQERVYRPILDDQATTAVLIRHRENVESTERSVSKGEECASVVKRKLMEENIEISETNCDFFDLTSCIMRTIEEIQNYPEDNVFVNISTGSKISAIGGLIACNGTGAHPYYVHVEGYLGEQVSTGVDDISELETYPLSLPHQQYVDVLQFIYEDQPVMKGDVVKFARGLPLLSEYDRSEIRNWYQPVDDEVIEPLVNQQYIEKIPRGNEIRFQLTRDGEDALQVLKLLTN